MKVEVKKVGDRELELEIWDEGHTLCNIIVNTALNNPDVEYCSYFIRHPLIPKSNLYILTKRGNPLKTLIDSVNEVINMMDKIKECFRKAVSEYG